LIWEGEEASGMHLKSPTSPAKIAGEMGHPLILWCWLFAGGSARATWVTASDAHGHYDVAVFVVVAFGGAELAGGLGIFQL